MIGLVLRLYPRRYRTEWGEEILAVYRQTVAEDSAVGRFREAADITAHAVRMRLGLNSTTATGRLLARAAPMAVGVATAYGALHLSRWYAGVAAAPAPVRLTADLWSVLLLTAALAVVGGVTALTGRWRAGVGTLTVGLVGLGAAAVVSGPAFGSPVVTPVLALLTALVVVACPPDLRPEPGACAAAGAMAAAAWLPVTAMYADVLPVSTDYGLWPLCVLAATGLARALRAASPGLHDLAAMAVACPLFLAYASTTGAWGHLLPALGTVAVLPLTGALAAGAHALRPRGGPARH